MVNNESQRLSPELKWSMRFSLSPHLKPCVLLMWFIKRLSQPKPLTQMHSIGCEEEIPVAPIQQLVASQAPQLQVSPPTCPPQPSLKGHRKRKGKEKNKVTGK